MAGLPNGTILKAEDGQIKGSSMQELEQLINSTKTVQVPTNSILIGILVLLSDTGQDLSRTNLATGDRYRFIQYKWNPGEPSEQPFNRVFGEETTVPFQPSNALTQTGSSVQFQFPSVQNGIGNRYRFEGDSFGEDLILNIYLGTAADPSKRLIANQNIGPFDGITTVIFESPIETTAGENYLLNISSLNGTNFDIKGDNVAFPNSPTQFVPWISADGHNSFDYNLVDVRYLLPHIKTSDFLVKDSFRYKVDTSAGAVNVSIDDSVNYFRIGDYEDTFTRSKSVEITVGEDTISLRKPNRRKEYEFVRVGNFFRVYDTEGRFLTSAQINP